MKRDVILRHNRKSNSDQTYVCHSHPFTSLPYLKSHIRPQFVIFNAGLKLLKAVDQKRVLDQQTALEQQQIETLVDDSPDLTFVMDLYKAWVWERPKGFEKSYHIFLPMMLMLLMLMLLMLLMMTITTRTMMIVLPVRKSGKGRHQLLSPIRNHRPDSSPKGPDPKENKR